MRPRQVIVVFAAAVLLWRVTLPLPPAIAEEATVTAHTVTVHGDRPRSDRDREIQAIKLEMQQLERRVEELESENSDIRKSNAELKTDTQKLQSSTSQQIEALKSKVATQSAPASFADAFNRYLGNHRFTVVGGAAGDFIYDRQSSINTFSLLLEPIILWQISDQLLFEGTIEAGLPVGSDAEFQLPVATFQYFLNDYAELVMGIFDQPFGDFYEDQAPVWVNRFITAPLPYGANPQIPPTDVGIQLRGGFQWGSALGQVADYTVWTANGPGYSQATCAANTPPSPLPTCNPEALVGDTLVSVNNIRLNTHTPSFGARIRVYPLSAESNLGRLELGASTYDGKWLNGFWLNSWGVDFNYFRDNVQARGEWMQTYRQMPDGIGADNRQGWYVQVGYFLTGSDVPFFPSQVNQLIDKLEPLVRYSGINQRAAVQSEIDTSPEVGFSGSPAVYAPHAREVALGLDYWYAPSVVWQNEFDFELPRAGGFYSDTGQSVGATANDRAFLSQFAIGF
jgi:ElaB/YqjD/DUF883 family membrane-anchored ribosome-binding protein